MFTISCVVGLILFHLAVCSPGLQGYVALWTHRISWCAKESLLALPGF